MPTKSRTVKALETAYDKYMGTLFNVLVQGLNMAQGDSIKEEAAYHRFAQGIDNARKALEGAVIVCGDDE